MSWQQPEELSYFANHKISSKFYRHYGSYEKCILRLGVHTTPGGLKADIGGFLKRKGILKNFAKFTGKHPCQGLFFNEFEGLILKLYQKETLA